MIDYIDISKCLHKDSPILSMCNPFSCQLNDFGWQTYYLQGCERMQVQWNPRAGMLRCRGSLPYFLKGHNFTFSRAEYIESIEVMQNVLGVGLWDAQVDAFEYGTIFEVDGNPAQYIKNHTAPRKSHLNENIRGKDNGGGKWWDNPSIILKMYDAGKNIKMKQGLTARDIIQANGYNPNHNYLKVEAKIKKPHLLNNERYMIVEDLQAPQWIEKLNTILIQQYHLLTPMKEIVQPTEKSYYTALDIAVGEYTKVLMNDGKSIEEAKRMIYNTINQAECLNKADKDARKATFRKTFGRLEQAEGSQWDVTQRMEESLQAENSPNKPQIEGNKQVDG